MSDKKHGHKPEASHEAEPATTTGAYQSYQKNAKQEPHPTELLGKDTLEKMEAELEKAQNEAKDHWEMSLRLQAEMQNIQRRAEQNIEKAHKFGLEKFASELLPVIDSLEMGLQNSIAAKGQDKDDPIQQGCELTLKMFQDVLKKFNIEVVDPMGEPFNPQLHEAMMMQENKEVAPNTVLVVAQKGYLLNGRILRPARVIISKNT